MKKILNKYREIKKTRKGFTLVELLVVIAILAVLASVSVVGYLGFTKKAKNSNALTELTQAREVIKADLIGGTGTYHVRATSSLNITTITEKKDGETKDTNSESYTVTFTYDKGSINSKYSLSYTCVKDGTLNSNASTIADAKWDTILKACFTDLATLSGTFEVTVNGTNKIDSIQYFTSDKSGSAQWKIEDDSLSSGDIASSTSENKIKLTSTTSTKDKETPSDISVE